MLKHDNACEQLVKHVKQKTGISCNRMLLHETPPAKSFGIRPLRKILVKNTLLMIAKFQCLGILHGHPAEPWPAPTSLPREWSRAYMLRIESYTADQRTVGECSNVSKKDQLTGGDRGGERFGTSCL